jgi:hypothetical protein
VNADPFQRKLTMRAPRAPPCSTSPTDQRDRVRVPKPLPPRLSPEELQEVEAAAERDGKSLAEWLRELALRSARERRADPIELLLAELMALRYALLNLFHPTALAGAEGEAVVTRFRAEDSRPVRRPETTKGPQATAGFLCPG